MVSYRVCLQVLPASLQARVPISAVLWLRMSEHLVNRHQYTWGGRGPQQSRAVECRAPSFLLYQRSYFKREWLWQKMTVTYCAHWYVKTPFQILHLSSSTFLNVYSNAHFLLGLLGHFKLFILFLPILTILSDYPLLGISESQGYTASQRAPHPYNRCQWYQDPHGPKCAESHSYQYTLSGSRSRWKYDEHETGASQWTLFLSRFRTRIAAGRWKPVMASRSPPFELTPIWFRFAMWSMSRWTSFLGLDSLGTFQTRTCGKHWGRSDCEANAFFPEFYPVISEGVWMLRAFLLPIHRSCNSVQIIQLGLKDGDYFWPGLDLQHVVVPEQL